MGEQLPRDVLFEIALNMDAPTLRNFCRSNKKASRICADPYFRDAWVKYHDQLTFEQRQAIDNVIDRAVDELMETTDYIVDDIDIIKKDIKENFRIKIGRDLRQLLLQHIPLYFKNLRDIHPKYGILIAQDFNDFLNYLFFGEIDVNPIFTDLLPVVDDNDDVDNIINNAMDDILKINGIYKINDFEELVQALPAFRQYEQEWYSLVPQK